MKFIFAQSRNRGLLLWMALETKNGLLVGKLSDGGKTVPLHKANLIFDYSEEGSSRVNSPASSLRPLSERYLNGLVLKKAFRIHP